MARYIFIAGGVMSGIGKGATISSIGRILKSKGFKIAPIKIDPYINVDAGTMNPIEHGEVFVIDDGTECDQDLGNYERFLGENLNRDNYMTTGSIYQAVINRERNLEYNGKCVEVVPHIPQEVISRIKRLEKKSRADFCLIEIGGTVGEYQNILFLEAARMLRLKQPRDVIFILVSYLPVPKMIGEMKTKPTQHAVRSLNSSGIQPDIIIARSSVPLDNLRKEKISVFCGVNKESIISAPDVKSIYEIPVNFEKDNLGNQILKKFGLKEKRNDLKDWKRLVTKINHPKGKIKIGIVGKYFKTGNFTLMDSYISVIEAVKHASYSFSLEPEIVWLSAEDYEKDPRRVKELSSFDGIIVPGGFGSRGVEGKIKAIQYCREKKIPFLGLCLGMQLAVIEFARNVANLEKANSTEFSKKCQVPVIDVMEEQKKNLEENKYGGTMRLGAYPCRLNPKSLSRKLYQQTSISERHRHRYELNNSYREILEEKGMLMAGINPDQDLVEIIEIPSHPFFLGVQFHPEFKSKPLKPHPLFKKFIKVAQETKKH
jgi:CTP synthase